MYLASYAFKGNIGEHQKTYANICFGQPCRKLKKSFTKDFKELCTAVQLAASLGKLKRVFVHIRSHSKTGFLLQVRSINELATPMLS